MGISRLDQGSQCITKETLKASKQDVEDKQRSMEISRDVQGSANRRCDVFKAWTAVGKKHPVRERKIKVVNRAAKVNYR